MSLIDKLYNPKNFESRINKKWKDKKFFSTHDELKRPFTVILPPPNVTGSLHLGHALNEYIQDTVIRYKKLEGYDVMWVPGMDHAGIATQSKVENIIYQNEGLTRHDLGREKFLEKVWEWKEIYANKFREQWDALGLAFDYEKERFTLDKDNNDAVNKAFIELYNKGLIYKDIKAINWDPKLQTALSNIEVINEPTEQIMYYIKYPLVGSNENLVIATVRTETLLSDVAVVFNPNDDRYKHLHGKFVKHPLTNKIIPLIADEYVDINFASGLMKLSAHAEVDIDLIKKHNLEVIESIDKTGKIHFETSIFNGLDRFEARKEIAKYLKENNFLEKEEKVTSNVGYSERSKAPVEILVMPQWFVKMEKFSKDILNHLKTKDAVKFFPERFINVLENWMNNAYDWTISRQLWWGHRIPAWYKEDEIKVQIESPGEGWVQDSDVLDTWFSSGLAPFSFLGWPNDDKLLKRYYPTSLLVTAYDIIFFWVARMYLFGLEFTNEKPFEEIIIHGLIRDEQNRKMSKSLNNGIEPLKVIDEFGSDALRYFIITNTTPGFDIRFSNEKIKSAWALCNKIWNIARYIQMLEDDDSKGTTEVDRWINNRLFDFKQKIDKLMQKYEFTNIGTEINNFVYNEFSSWYIELLRIKPNKKAALNNLKNMLIILHPFLPFLTDYLFEIIFNDELLEHENPKINLSRCTRINTVDNVIKVINILRKYREDKKISKKEIIYFDTNVSKSDFFVESVNKLANANIKENDDTLFIDGKIQVRIKESDEVKNNYLEDLKLKIEKVKFEIQRAENMLNNENFIKKAPEAKINLEKEKLEKYRKELKEYNDEVSKWS
ncbi:Valine--tRNA ligase [Mycoplasmopsis maculosa]|uniref:Valine--tRNA ligase n=1 Tax=Mycoplasmopsis maculosa TaxID=114885 RepID=A0A449B4H1_9BACT|nr:valine--tRNA ligase [Mycoplasmopsis maculosa]VEU75469.1 Valine--tRNA ligase [Mycoplasmopsis maculosa]